MDGIACAVGGEKRGPRRRAEVGLELDDVSKSCLAGKDQVQIVGDH